MKWTSIKNDMETVGRVFMVFLTVFGLSTLIVWLFKILIN